MNKRLEQINRAILRIQLQIAELLEHIDYSEPGSYYLSMKEIELLEREAADLNEEWYEVQNNPNS